jgi:hypothetical protein
MGQAVIIVTGHFVGNPRIADGTLVVIRPLHSIVWAGSVRAIPEWVANMEGVTLHVHPDMLARIEAAVSKIEKGIPLASQT